MCQLRQTAMCDMIAMGAVTGAQQLQQLRQLRAQPSGASLRNERQEYLGTL
jgi:hypothetical protein